MEYAHVNLVIKAPIEDVWAVISAFGDVKRWTPVIDDCMLEGEGTQLVRIVTGMGSVFRERLVSLDASAHRLIYAIEDPNILPVVGAEGTISLRVLEPTVTEVNWVANAESLELPAAQVTALIEPVYAQSLQTLKVLLEA